MGKKKVLIFKHCYNLHFGSRPETGVIMYEVDHPIKELVSKGYDVTVCTIDRYHKQAFEGVKCINWEQLYNCYNDFDLAIIWNGSFNAFGGKIGVPALSSYNFLNKFTKPIIFCVTDTAIPIGDCAGWIKGAQKKGNYLELDSADYTIRPTEIHCLTQTHNIDKFKDHWKGGQNRFGTYEFFPHHMYAMKKQNLQLGISADTQRDLIYFGNMRSGKRNKKFIEFFDGHDGLVVDVYGKWKDSFTKDIKANFLGPIDTRDLNVEINKSLATVYISDEFNEDCIWTTRFYEAVFNRTIMFVDIDNDPKRVYFDDFFYISSRKELYDKIKLIKNNPGVREDLLNKQFTALYFHVTEMKRFPQKWDSILNRIAL